MKEPELREAHSGNSQVDVTLSSSRLSMVSNKSETPTGGENSNIEMPSDTSPLAG